MKRFESMKMFLKGKIEESNEMTRIRDKLYKFLTYNPDVDHYLCEIRREERNRSSVFGMYAGFLIGLGFGLLLLLIAMLNWMIYGLPKLW